MLFNSFEFAFFLPIVFALYWFVAHRSLKLQNFLVLLASYVFYGWWDWRFLSLIALSTLLDYTAGLQIHQSQSQNKRKFWLGVSLLFNLGMLGFFKYWNFFVQSWIDAWAGLGVEMSGYSLGIILPVGISFYTFQTLSYTIDVYRKNLEPTKDFIAFSAFVSFFPQLVAGPIERATNLLPQFYKKRNFSYELGMDGMKQIVWGLAKKVIIADNCAVLVNDIFANYETLPASALVLGAVYFAFQIYADFSGYSDIAIGTGKLFGFELMTNFRYPYFSRDIAEFWRRWHISLSTWFRDYLYIPLGGSRGGNSMRLRNTMIIFVVSGFWHGANWTFVIWGALNALFFLPLLLGGNNRRNLDTVAEGSMFPSLQEFMQVLLTFLLTCFAWIFFRAANITEAIDYIIKLVDPSLFSIPFGHLKYLPYIFVLVAIEWVYRTEDYPLKTMNYNIAIIVFAILIFVFGNFNLTEFIYFQF